MTDHPAADQLEAPSLRSPAAPKPRTLWFALGFFLFLWAIVCRHLAGEWTINDQYNYGWFVPFFAAYLFWTRWENRPVPAPPLPGLRLRLIFFIADAVLLFLLPIRLFEVGNPDWRMLGWIHALGAAAITLIALWAAGGKPWLRHFVFPIAFFFVAVPWLLIIEEPVVQFLMRIVAMGASETATLCGIPAEFEGNLIRVNAGVVGVSEACSGVRSLQTSLMLGLLFGDLARLNVARRIWLVIGAVVLAIAANFARAFFLVYVAADQGLSGVDRWHDFAGYFILGTVFAGSVLLAFLLYRRQGKTGAAAAPPSSARNVNQRSDTGLPAALRAPVFIGAFCWLLAIEVGVEAWYRFHERNLSAQLPWSVQWPSGPHAKSLPIDERVKRILRFNDGGSAEWQVAFPQAPARALLFFFRWAPGSTSITRARGHRPDICLPSTGWELSGDHGLRYYKATDKFALPFRHYGFRREEDGRAVAFGHAFFCVYEDLVPESSSANAAPDATTMEVTRWMIAERCKVVWKGLRNPGQQVLELFLLSRQEIPATVAEARFAEILPSLIRVGEGPPASTSR